MIVLPDADMDMATRIVSESAFGCAGQRCLAVSVAITVGEAQEAFSKRVVEAAAGIRVGDGLEEKVQMGPVITPESKARIENLIDQGIREGAKALLDGRVNDSPSLPRGYFVKPTILDGLPAVGTLSHTEIFGPVLSLVHARTLEEGMQLITKSPYGNAASLFTSSGTAARTFRYEVPAGNIGINIGVAAPMAYFPFSGWRDSFFGVLHGQGRDGVEFYTEEKVVIERWPKEWSRRF